MTTVQINDRPPVKEQEIKFIMPGELFRYNDNIYLMTDEADCDGDKLALIITDESDFGALIPFDETEYATRLNGTIIVQIK